MVCCSLLQLCVFKLVTKITFSVFYYELCSEDGVISWLVGDTFPFGKDLLNTRGST